MPRMNGKKTHNTHTPRSDSFNTYFIKIVQHRISELLDPDYKLLYVVVPFPPEVIDDLPAQHHLSPAKPSNIRSR